MNDINERVERLLLDSPKAIGEKEIAGRLRAGADEIREALRMLEKLGAAARAKGGWSAPSCAGMARGILEVNPRGFGFLRVDERDDPRIPGEGDAFVSPGDMGGALHGDTCLCRVWRENDGRRAARVERVLAKKVSEISGVVRSAERGYIVVSGDRRLPDVAIARHNKNKKSGFRAGDVVVARLSGRAEPGSAQRGEFLLKLGEEGDGVADLLAIAHAHGFSHVFGQAVLAQAAAAPADPTAEALEGRRDFRGALCFTIDGEDAQDFDDAVGLERTKDGFTLHVHIADVSETVTPGSALDADAYARGTSVYLPGLTLPMLPHSLSNGYHSLVEGRDRLTLTASLSFDASGALVGFDIAPSVIRSRHRMTYTACNRMLAGDADTLSRYADIAPTLTHMIALSRLMRKKRAARGALDLDVPEAHIALGERGEVLDVRARERGESERMIEDFMLAANEAVAKFARENRVPVVYRVHEAPDRTRIEDELYRFARTLGFRPAASEGAVSPAELAALLAQASEDEGASRLLSYIMLRSLKKADYRPSPEGHFGLALADYCHFTSPIRRYPDLLTHRALKLHLAHALDGVTRARMEALLPDASLESSRRERDAMEAEREADDLRKAQYMARHIGETFDGIVSGIAPSALFVALPSTVEGLIPLTDMDDRYQFDPERLLMTGAHTRRVIRIGQPMRVVIESASESARRVFMREAKDGDAPPSKETQADGPA